MPNVLQSTLKPNTTQIPNIILDEWMMELSGTEFKVLMLIARQTYGWHKDSDRISYTQLKEKTGSANGSVGSALRSLREAGYILVTDKEGNEVTTKEQAQLAQELYYSINMDVSKKWRGTSPKIGDTKETPTKEIFLSNDKNRVNPEVEEVLKVFAESTGLDSPGEPRKTYRQYAHLIARDYSVTELGKTIEWLKDKKLTISKLSTLYYRIPDYLLEVNGKRRTRALTSEEKELQDIYGGPK